MALRDCCNREAGRNLEKHRDVATCDECGSLLLAYADEDDFRSTVEELESRGVGYDTDRQGELRVVAKHR